MVVSGGGFIGSRTTFSFSFLDSSVFLVTVPLTELGCDVTLGETLNIAARRSGGMVPPGRSTKKDIIKSSPSGVMESGKVWTFSNVISKI